MAKLVLSQAPRRSLHRALDTTLALDSWPRVSSLCPRAWVAPCCSYSSMLQLRLQGPSDVLVTQGQLPREARYPQSLALPSASSDSRRGSRAPQGLEQPYLPKTFIKGGTEHIQIRVPRVLPQVSVEYPETL